MIVTLALNEQNILTGRTEYQPGSWINIVNPTPEELKEAASLYNVPIEFLQDSLDLEESGRIEHDEETNSTLIINDFPVADANNPHFESYITIPIGIIHAEKVIITICSQKCEILNSLIRRNVNPKMKSQFTLNVMLLISTQYLEYLRRLQKLRIATEKQLRHSLQNKQLYDLMEIEKSLVYFLTSLRSNRLVLDRMPRSSAIKLYEEDRDLLEDVMIENRQGIETSELYTRILNSMTDTYSSLISNDMNNIMKFLTVVTIILTIPTLVFSFYGMNVELPMDEIPFAWIITLVISLLLSVWLVAFFWKRKMF